MEIFSFGLHAPNRAKTASSFIRPVILAVCVALATPYAYAQPDEAKQISLLTIREQANLDSMLTKLVQGVVDRQKRLDGQGKFIKAKVRIDPNRNDGTVFVDLGRSYIPKEHTQKLEDALDEIRSEISAALSGKITYGGTSFLFDGKNIHHYFPDPPRQPVITQKSARDAAVPYVVIAAGHGVYHNDSWGWIFMRNVYNGIREDLITPYLADELSRHFFYKSDATVYLTRTYPQQSSIHEPSGHQWWEMAGRYVLQSNYPNNPEIWNSRPNDTAANREEKEDWESRPNYANYLGADALINLHTNGSETNPALSGTKVFYQEGRTADRDLGNSMLCYMKENIQSQAAYANFSVASNAEFEDKAETRLATMPAIIIETAFHTNAGDAAALQDPVFQKAAMSGVEKGYRLYKEGKTACEPFKITIPAATGPRSGFAQIPINYTGHPNFTVELASVPVSATECPSTDRTCKKRTASFGSDTPSPLSFSLECSPTSVTKTRRWRTTLTDNDGVKAVAEHSVTCAP